MQKQLKSFKGGIHPPNFKNTSELKTVVMPLPTKVIIPMLQHIGSACEPIVKKGDYVFVGQKIGETKGFVSSPVHSSVSGTVIDIKPYLGLSGETVLAVEIVPDGLQKLHKSIAPINTKNKADLIEKIKESGIVGLGGAGFPTFIKLSPPPDKKIDTLIINGAECEPFITSDYREMIEKGQSIIDGIKLLMSIIDVKKVFIGIEKNKQKAINYLSKLIEGDNSIEIVALKTRYPQGGEKQLIYAITGLRVPMNGLPLDVGVVVQNVNTVSFLAEYIKTGIPLIKKRVTVEGTCIKNAMNIEVLIGTSLSEVFEFCGGFSEKPKKIIVGGPMMGVAQFSLDSVVLKPTNAIIALCEKDISKTVESVCIRCGKCVFVCPMELLPLSINALSVNGRAKETINYYINDCIECGCCSYICPASRHIVQSIRNAKIELKKSASNI